MAETIRVAAAGDIHCAEPLRERITRAFADLEGTADVVLLAGERAGDALAQGLGAVDVTCRGNADRLGHRAACSPSGAFTNGNAGIAAGR